MVSKLENSRFPGIYFQAMLVFLEVLVRWFQLRQKYESTWIISTTIRVKKTWFQPTTYRYNLGCLKALQVTVATMKVYRNPVPENEDRLVAIVTAIGGGSMPRYKSPVYIGSMCFYLDT